MKRNKCFYFACLLTGTLGCSSGWAASPNANAASSNANAAAPNAKAAPANAKAAASSAPFEQLVDDFVFGTLALSPTTATSYGYHVHNGASLDDVLDDFSALLFRSGRKQPDRLNGNIANDASQFDGPGVKHFALSLDTADDRKIVNLAGNRRQRLAILALGCLMVEALRNSGFR